jgi:hypothetical protein
MLAWQVLSALVFFYFFYAQTGLDCNLPIYASYVAGMTGMCLHAQLLLVKMWSCEVFALASLEPQSSQFPPPK